MGTTDENFGFSILDIIFISLFLQNDLGACLVISTMEVGPCVLGNHLVPAQKFDLETHDKYIFSINSTNISESILIITYKVLFYKFIVTVNILQNQRTCLDL